MSAHVHVCQQLTETRPEGMLDSSALLTYIFAEFKTAFWCWKTTRGSLLVNISRKRASVRLRDRLREPAELKRNEHGGVYLQCEHCSASVCSGEQRLCKASLASASLGA